MVTLKDVERVFISQQNTTGTFATSLPVGGTVPLASIAVPVGRDRDAFLVRATMNWNATFTPLLSLLTLTGLGFAQVTFELLRDGVVIGRVTDTINQPDGSIGAVVATTTVGFDTTTVEVLDTSSITGAVASGAIAIFELRATNIVAVGPVNVLGTVTVPLATVTLAAALTTLVIEEIEACRAQSI
ncbi:MAG TPA: hypothetical protein DEA44_03180 [Firmicutes bacterium]|nr:hypothetical protein [Bacillota bacterium]